MTEALILALNQEVAERGGQLVVAILPDETEVDPDKWAGLLQAYPALFDQGATSPTARLGQFLAAAGIPYLQLGPALRAYQAETGEPLYFPIDGHWQPAGHRVAAQAIYDYLLQHTDHFEGFPR